MFWDNLQVCSAVKGKYIPGKRPPASLWRQSWEFVGNNVGGAEEEWEETKKKSLEGCGGRHVYLSDLLCELGSHSRLKRE